MNGFSFSDSPSLAGSGLVTTGLLAYFPCNETSGTVMHDASGNGNNGTFAAGGNAPSWTSSGLYMTGSSSQWVDLPSALNGALTIQVYTVPWQPATLWAGTGTPFPGTAYGTILGPSSGNFPQIYGTGGPQLPAMSGTGATTTQTFFDYGAPHVWTFVVGNGTQLDQIWCDDVQVAYGSQVDSTFSLGANHWRLGATGGGGNSIGTIGSLVMYSGQLSPTQICQNVTYIQQQQLGRGASINLGPLANTTNTINELGDSITRGAGVTNPYGSAASMPGLVDTYTITNMGNPGMATPAMVGLAEGFIVNYCSMFGKNVVSVFAGTNDNGSGLQAAQSWQNLCNIVGTLRKRLVGTNTKFLVITMLSRTGLDAYKNTLNALIRANFRQCFDGLVDFASDPLAGADGAYASATYFQGDNVHPTQALQTILGGYYQTAVNSIWYRDFANPTTTTATTYTVADIDVYLRWNGAAAGTITLPTAVGYTNQQRKIRNVTSSLAATLTPQSGQTINGASTYNLAAGQVVTLQSVLVSASAGGCNWETV